MCERDTEGMLRTRVDRSFNDGQKVEGVSSNVDWGGHDEEALAIFVEN